MLYFGKTKAGCPEAKLFDPISGVEKTENFDTWAATLMTCPIDSTTMCRASPARRARRSLSFSTPLGLWATMASSVPRLDFDPVNRLRARGDVRVGDTVRFKAGVDVKDSDGEPIKCLGRTMPREITGKVIADRNDDDDDEESASSQPEVVNGGVPLPIWHRHNHAFL